MYEVLTGLKYIVLGVAAVFLSFAVVGIALWAVLFIVNGFCLWVYDCLPCEWSWEATMALWTLIVVTLGLKALNN